MADENQVETLEINDPAYVLRVCRVDERGKLRPTIGWEGFEWPRLGKVEDASFRRSGSCGHGLHGCLPEQILKANATNLLNPDKEAVEYLVVEVERSDLDYIESWNKVKYPRGNVVYAGSWRRCLEILSEKGCENVPTEAEMLKAYEWVSLDGEKVDPLDTIEFPKLDGYCRQRDGDPEQTPSFDDVWALRVKMATGYTFDDAEAREYAEIMHNSNVALRYYLWALIQKNINNLFQIHPHIEKLMVVTASGRLDETDVKFTSNHLFKWYANTEMDIFQNHSVKHIDPDSRALSGRMAAGRSSTTIREFKSYLRLRAVYRIYNQDPPHRPLSDFVEE